MHLLATTPGTIADGSAAVDLAQSRGDIVVLSRADTDIALLAAAQSRRHAQDASAPRLKLAPILRLGHNFSVDLYMETVAHARLVVARLLGDDKPDPELAQLSTLEPEQVHRLRRYLAEGGPSNADNLLRYAGSLIG